MLRVQALGLATFSSPLAEIDRPFAFTDDAARVLRESEWPRKRQPGLPRSFEKAGPRARIFFDPRRSTAAILSAGGLCPGTNDVIRSLELELRRGYGVGRILGLRFGFAGLAPLRARPAEGQAAPRCPPLVLDDDAVRDIHMRGGTVLGTSRGPGDPDAMAKTLHELGVDMLFAIGGDGTMRAAHALYEASVARRTPLAVVGIPKTIDNDIAYVDKTFGFETAVAVARGAIDAAHAEASSVARGVGLVKLMGRSAGFLAVHATLASHDVNACLVPEVPFDIPVFLAWLEERLARRDHALVVVAEGCAVAFAGPDLPRDASGNVRFSGPELDVGRRLKEAIEAHFVARGAPVQIRYIDPSYMVRGTRATSVDAAFCDALGRNAVHAAMAGKTDLMVGRWHRSFTHVPLPLVLSSVKRVDRDGELWRDVLDTTGQPSFIRHAGDDR